MVKIVIWIIIGLVMFLYLYACCRAGSSADDWMEDNILHKDNESDKENDKEVKDDICNR